MALSSELNKLSFNGNDSTTVFAVSFIYYANTDLRVILVSSTGTETPQTLGADFTLVGGGGATGTLTMTVAPASGEKLIIKSNRPTTQETELPTGGRFASTAVELRLDIITRLIQQTEEVLSRTLVSKESTTALNLVLPDPAANQFLKWNDSATALTTASSSVTATLLTDTDGDTSVEVEQGVDDDTIRFNALGVEVATMVSTTFALAVALTTTSTIDGRDVAADGTKLDGIEALADVTDSANVTAAGALMDSELAGIAAVKATTAAFLTADETKLDGIEALADVTDATNVNAAGAVMESDFAANSFRYKNNASTMASLVVATNTFLARQTGEITDIAVGTSEFVGRASTGNIRNLTGAESRTILGIEAGSTADQTNAEIKTAYEANSDTNVFDDAAQTKLGAIEALADVTDTANVTSAGALMDSELAGIAAVKATTAAFLTADETKLDAIEASADVTDTSNVTSAGALMDSEVDANIKTLVLPASTTISAFGRTLIDDAAASNARTTLALVIGTDVQAHSAVLDATTAAFLTADETKLDGIEATADITDTTNVTSAGALMDSEVDANLKTFVLPASTTISTFGRTIIDDADAGAVRTTLGLVIGTNVMPEITLVTNAEAEAGSATTERAWSSLRVREAVEAAPAYVQVQIEISATDLTTGTAKAMIHIPFARKLTAVHAEVATAGTTGVSTFDINRNGTTMLSTKLTIDSGETGSDTAADAAVIDTGQDDTSINDVITIDTDGLSTTVPKGLTITMTFENS